MISRALSRRFASQKALLESSVSVQDRILSLKWSDGTSGRFPLIWLRDCSPDEKTYTRSPAMTARNLTMRAFDVEASPSSISVDATSQELVIDWPGDVHSRYPSDWLRLRNPTDDAARARRRKVYLFPESTWGKSEIESRLKRFDHDKLLNDDKTLHDFLEAVCLDGIAVVKGGPVGGRTAVQDIGRRIGLIQRTHFGEVFEVSTKADASNMAYASDGELPFHTDFPSLANPPQLQMLHMFSRAAEGGNSIFVDGFHVAEQMRREHPDLFRLLTTYSAEYIEEGYDVHDSVTGEPQTYSFDMCARHKVIRLDDSGRVVKIQFGNAMRSWFYDCEPETVQEIYRAMKVFTDMCYRPENVLKFQLENGDTVLWSNTRLLHTRDAFRNAPGTARTLYGCYFAWDMIKSRVRVIRDQLGLEQNQPSA